MKRFFIFAAMLLTMTVNSMALTDEPPKIKPPAENIVLVPQGMYDIDRSIAICEYTVCTQSKSIYISCFGTGSDTELYLVSSTGSIVEYEAVDADNAASVIFELPQSPGIYYIVLESGSYYGEGRMVIE